MHVSTHQPKQYAQLHFSPSPGFFAHNCFWVWVGFLLLLLSLLLLFPWNFFFSPNKILKKKTKSLCLKILFKLQATAPIQEAFLRFLRSLLCVLTIRLFVPYNTTTFCPTYYLCFPSPGLYKVLEDRHHFFCSVTREVQNREEG